MQLDPKSYGKLGRGLDSLGHQLTVAMNDSAFFLLKEIAYNEEIIGKESRCLSSPSLHSV